MPLTFVKEEQENNSDFETALALYAIKSIREQKSLQSPEDLVFIRYFERFEKKIIIYFEANKDIDFKSSVYHFSKPLLRIKDFGVKKIRSDESFRNKVMEMAHTQILKIIDHKLPKTALNYAVIGSLAITKEPAYQKLVSDLGGGEIPYPNTDSFSDYYWDILIKSIFTNIKIDDVDEIAPDLKDFLVSSFVIDFGLILNDLKTDNKIIFENSTEENIAKAIVQCNSTYKSKIPVYHDYLRNHRYWGEINFEIDGLESYFIKNGFKNPQLILSELSNVKSFGDLEDNWDDNGALAIKVKHIRAAVKAITSIFYQYKMIPSFTAPTVACGVLIEYLNSTNDKRLDIRFEDDSEPYSILFTNGKINAKKNFEISDINWL